MAEGQLKRIQPDIVKEVESFEGGSFSEKLQRWKLDEVEQTLDSVQNLTGRNKALTIEDYREMLDERLSQLEDEYSNDVNDSLTLNDIDTVIRSALEDLEIDNRTGEVKLQ